MPQIVITHGVADVDTWLKSKSEHPAAILRRSPSQATARYETAADP
jgi:hypothetical protein